MFQVQSFIKIHQVGSDFSHVKGHADGQTDVTKPIVVFRNFANAPKTTVYGLRAGRSGDRIPMGRGGEISRTCPDRPWGPPSLLYNGYRVFRGIKKGRSVALTPHPLLVPLVKKDRAIPPYGRTACTEPQCLYKGALYLYLLSEEKVHIPSNTTK
jgi:hypothetical protein